MASKRKIKSRVKEMVYDIMDECDYVIVSEAKGAKKAEKLMDEAVEFYESTISKINSAKNKTDFKTIVADIDAKEDAFLDQVNSINQ